MAEVAGLSRVTFSEHIQLLSLKSRLCGNLLFLQRQQAFLRLIGRIGERHGQGLSTAIDGHAAFMAAMERIVRRRCDGSE